MHTDALGIIVWFVSFVTLTALMGNMGDSLARWIDRRRNRR